MSIRHVARTAGVTGAVASVSALSALAFAGTAGALSSGSQLNAIVPISPAPPSGQTVIPGTPFSSGQTVSVQVPAETVLSQGANVSILECAAPNGVLPTLPSQCDPNTISASTIIPAADGSFTYNLYQIYALPDANLGETASNPVTCGNTAAAECVLGMFDSYTDFTAPHLFSQVFKVTATAGDTGINPGDGTPEVPLVVGLPLAAAGIMGGVVYRRRRHARSAA